MTEKSYCRMANETIEHNDRRCNTCPLSDHKGGCNYVEENPVTEFPSYVVDDNPGELLCQKALQFAAVAHKGTYRKASQTPYIVHPVEVTGLVREIISDLTDEDKKKIDAYNVIAASSLHDVVEDTGVSAAEIKATFGDGVASLVASETENKRRDLPASQTWHIRKQEFLDHLGASPFGAQIIALADKLSNAMDLAKERELEGDNMWQKFNEKDPAEHRWYFETIAQILEKPLGYTRAYKAYLENIVKIFD